MKYIIISLLVINVFALQAQTQGEMNAEALESLNQTELELADVYRSILNEYQDDKEFIVNIENTQRIWLELRDAQLKMRYPKKEAGHYGSIHPVCLAHYKKELTRSRINSLGIWIEGIEEGNVCFGSVKLKN